MTYTSLLALVILGDDFKRLNRKGLLKFLHESQLPDGRYFCSLLPLYSGNAYGIPFRRNRPS
jgi:prenyltransferase beta subunit